MDLHLSITLLISIDLSIDFNLCWFLSFTLYKSRSIYWSSLISIVSYRFLSVPPGLYWTFSLFLLEGDRCSPFERSNYINVLFPQIFNAFNHLDKLFHHLTFSHCNLQDAESSPSQTETGKEGKSKPKENPEEKKKWAIPVDILSPCEDFYKRIPNPAFKVGNQFWLSSKLSLSECDGSLWVSVWLPALSSASVALWVGHFPEAGCAEAGSPRIRVCSRSHLGWQNGGGRVRHRSLPETHDKVSNCCYILIAGSQSENKNIPDVKNGI